VDLRIDPAGRYARVIAVVALLQGLSDAAHILGVAMGSASPIETFGVFGFTWLTVFAVARLFAAVGLWLQATWGAAMLIGATALELGLFLWGGHTLQLGFFGFALRLIVLIGTILLVMFARALSHQHAHE
jgi:hypothetical protein